MTSLLLVSAFALVAELDGGGAVPPPIAVPADVDAGTPNDAGPTAASGLVMQARIEPDPVPFGGRFDLVIEVTRERGEPLKLPGTLPQNDACALAGDVRRSVVELAPVDGGMGTRVKEVVRVPYLALDTQDVSSPALVVTAKDGSSLDIPALPVRVDVPADTGPDGGPLQGPDGGPVAPGEVALEPAAGTLAYRVPDARPWVMLSAAFFSSIALWIVRVMRRRLKPPATTAAAIIAAPPRPAHEIALERLDALLASGMLTRGDTAVFVERLMDDVLRDYLTARFNLGAGTRTTRELVKDLLGAPVVGLDVALVEDLLRDADLVKFAKASIPSQRAHAMAQRVRALVVATARVAVVSGAPR